MFSAIRSRMHWSPSAVIATLALVFAMSGGAYAAGRYVITSTKQISPKVLSALRGKAGANGTPGAVGPAGGVGPVGAQGLVGATGVEGPRGKEGPAGENGEAGKEGSPWTAGGTLPPGKTLKGEWAVRAYPSYGEQLFTTTVNYGLSLAKAPTTHFIAPGAEAPAGCTGGSVERPTAEKGNLCVYSREEEDSLNEVVEGPEHFYFPKLCSWATGACLYNQGREGKGSLIGFGIGVASKEAGQLEASGSWAVTAGE